MNEPKSPTCVGDFEGIATQNIAQSLALTSGQESAVELALAYRDLQLGIALRKCNTLTSPEGIAIVRDLCAQLVEYGLTIKAKEQGK